jgi:uncharacterized damage-inducible protein DinB
METFFQDCLDRLQRLHGEMEFAMEGLPQSALDWMPGTGMNSLCVLAVHVAGAERYWIGDVIAREPSSRDRQAEFRAQGLDAATLRKRLRDALNCCQSAFGRLTLEDLAESRVSPRDGRRTAVSWSIAHILEHTAVHTGHMQVTRQLWEQRGKH